MTLQLRSDFVKRIGAEATIDLIEWYGEPIIRKRRFPKDYRNPKLDQNLRSRRTKQEIVILHAAKLSGVLCPRVLFADPESCEIFMEYVDGVHLRDFDNSTHKREIGRIFEEVGETVARLHKGKISHGDLTTKNIFVKEGKIIVIDFGLSFFSERTEDRADDLHLLKQALLSTNLPPFASSAFSRVMKGYEKIYGKEYAKAVSSQIKEIEKRGRYARVD